MNSQLEHSMIFKDTKNKIQNLPDGKPKDLLRKLWKNLILTKTYIAPLNGIRGCGVSPIAEFFEKEKNDDIFKSESHIFELIIAII